MADRSASAAAPTHRLAREHAGALLAGSGSTTALAELLAIQHSWRKLQLRVLLDEIRGSPDASGPLPPPEQPEYLLTRAEERSPSIVDDLLSHPYIGTWANGTLRRLRDDSTVTFRPLWIDIGYLHCLAAAAAIRCGIPFHIAVPVLDGYVVLPTLGAATLPATGRWSHAEASLTNGVATIRVEGTTVLIPPSDTADGVNDAHSAGNANDAGWESLPRIRAEARGQALTLTVECHDPYRDLRTSDTMPPTTANIGTWQRQLDHAWQLLVTNCPERAATLACGGLRSVTPLPAIERFRPASASGADSFGACASSEPFDPYELAATLVHEFQHNKLGALLLLDSLQHGEPPQRLYAPWRDDPRPLSGMLHGVYAFTGVADFWRACALTADGTPALVAAFEYRRWSEQLRLVLRTLRELPQLNQLGVRLVSRLTETVETWTQPYVPDPVAAVAADAIVDHRTRWRLHHLRPDREVVATLARAWLSDVVPPPIVAPGVDVVPDLSARRLDTLAVLALWLIQDRKVLERHYRDRDRAGDHPVIAGATAADLALILGDLPAAQADLTATLVEHGNHPAAWAGLRLVAERTGSTMAGEALRHHPELVQAVHCEVRRHTSDPIDPLMLAGWLSQGPESG